MDAVYAVILDVLLLSESDYIVCTFSSQVPGHTSHSCCSSCRFRLQVCRLAYELMQMHHVDASQQYYSLDDIYYFGGQQGHDVRAIMNHTAQREGKSVGPSVAVCTVSISMPPQEN